MSLHSIPPELLLEIFEHLAVADAASFVCTSRRFHAILTAQLWALGARCRRTYTSRWTMSPSPPRSRSPLSSEMLVLVQRGYTPLHWAAEHNRLYVAQQLISYGADVNAATYRLCKRPLHYALQNGDSALGVVKLLVQAGADVKMRDDHMCGCFQGSPLNSAINRGALHIARELLRVRMAGDHGVNARNEHGQTRLHRAVMRSRGGPYLAETLVLLLLEHKDIDVNAREDCGLTALHRAATVSPKMVQMLLDGGADVNCVDQKGFTALHCAVLRGNLDIVRLLVERGVDKNARNFLGETARDHAARLVGQPQNFDQALRDLGLKHAPSLHLS